MLTTIKTETGVFEVLWNGERTAWVISNSMLGLSGRDTVNLYSVLRFKNGECVQKVRVGSLQSCKRLLALKFAGK